MPLLEGLLEELDRQEGKQPPPNDVDLLIAAIREIDLTVEQADNSRAVEALGAALSKALASNKDALVKALKGIEVAPTVNVEPAVLNLEANLPQPKVEVMPAVPVAVVGRVVSRDRNGDILEFRLWPEGQEPKPPKKETGSYE